MLNYPPPPPHTHTHRTCYGQAWGLSDVAGHTETTYSDATTYHHLPRLLEIVPLISWQPKAPSVTHWVGVWGGGGVGCVCVLGVLVCTIYTVLTSFTDHPFHNVVILINSSFCINNPFQSLCDKGSLRKKPQHFSLLSIAVCCVGITVYLLIYRTATNNYFGNCPGIIGTDFYRACKVSEIIRTSK